MPASSTKKRPPMEMEAGPVAIREGEDDQEMPFAKGKPSRKRSAKGAKETKAPMDGGMYGKAPMDGEACSCGKRKGACKKSCGKAVKDGSCMGKKDRNDALTPQEYLAACDLGIQGRARSYIRARLDAAERLDKKCGASGIAENKKCNIGTGNNGGKGGSLEKNALAASKSVKPNNALKNIAFLGAVGGALGLATHIENQKTKGMEAREVISKVKDLKYKANSGVVAAARGAQHGVDFARTARYYKENPGQREGAVRRAMAQGMASVEQAQATRKAVYGEAREALRELGKAVPSSPARKRRARAERKARNAPGGALTVRDTYADGFSLDQSLLSV